MSMPTEAVLASDKTSAVRPTRVTLNQNVRTYTHGKVKRKGSSNIVLPARANQAFSTALLLFLYKYRTLYSFTLVSVVSHVSLGKGSVPIDRRSL